MAELWSPGDIQSNINGKRGRPLSRDTVTRWQRRDDFPKPKMQHGAVRFYDRAEVLAWHAEYKLRNPKKREILELHRADPERSIYSIAQLAGVGWGTARDTLREFGLLT